MSAALDRVLPRLPDAKKNARGWHARCPAHDDRGPSLSIAEGRGGRVLLRCFAGCSFEQIAHALGVDARELSPRSNRAGADRELARQRAAYRRAPRATVEAFLAREIERQREQRLERDGYDTPQIRSVDVNVARERANAIFGLSLAPIARYLWEGYAPHDCDAMWPTLFERALDELARELHHFRNPSARAGDTAPPPAFLLPLAADRAAGWLRVEERAAAATARIR